ncbi:MAG: beta-lactamase domain protein [Pelosinus sp.]|jgi:glyoxylase-like metal-dependent hydrolase (beta-lactamase superfamily II)|nr:beta-lactamase domain protein [Pelosinus sp.]
MDKIIDVTGGQGGKAFLLIGEEKTALVDCGMAYCAPTLISNIKQVLGRRTLDYILISHSHYDHIGAIPYLREEWPNLKVLGAEYAKGILNRENALKDIRNLSVLAAKFYGAGDIKEYGDDMLKVDNNIFDGDSLDLGGVIIKVIEAQGHTKCSLSFLVNNETLFASESTGYKSKSGKVYPAFITSCSQAIDSINRSREINPRFIISPHFGLVNQSDTLNYWEECILAVKETKDFILRLSEKGYEEEQILIEYEEAFRDEESRLEQPSNAFRLNAQSMIKTVLNEGK